MHPDPKHLKNFARNTQWSRGKSVMNILFLSRSHLPGFERLNASGRVCHLIRAIGHHIVRLACLSVTIMARLSACWGTHIGIRPAGTRRSLSPDTGRREVFQPPSITQTCCRQIRSGTAGRAVLDQAGLAAIPQSGTVRFVAERTLEPSWWQIVTTIVRSSQHRKNARIAKASGRRAEHRVRPVRGYCRVRQGTQLSHA